MIEALNIISESYYIDKVGGPYKVVHNTIKGLDLIGHPYVINKKIENSKYNWIHDSAKGLIEVGLKKIPAIIGPNIVVLPKDLPRFRPDLTNCIYLHPSSWCVDVWKAIGFLECSLKSWPVGIDTEEFVDLNRNPSGKEVLIYFKRRDPALLELGCNTVKKMGFTPRVIKYGDYNEIQYKQLLSKCTFGIWIGISESQGIGLQEALASGLPLIVCDVNSLFESAVEDDYRFPEKLRSFKPTSAPYFDDRCGIIINDFSKLDESIKYMTANISYYKPREFIIENLSLEKQAKELLTFFDILEAKSLPVTLKSNAGVSSNPFRPSFHGRIIYSIFVIRRKVRTLFRKIRILFKTGEVHKTGIRDQS